MEVLSVVQHICWKKTGKQFQHTLSTCDLVFSKISQTWLGLFPSWIQCRCGLLNRYCVESCSGTRRRARTSLAFNALSARRTWLKGNRSWYISSHSLTLAEGGRENCRQPTHTHWWNVSIHELPLLDPICITDLRTTIEYNCIVHIEQRKCVQFLYMRVGFAGTGTGQSFVVHCLCMVNSSSVSSQ